MLKNNCIKNLYFPILVLCLILGLLSCELVKEVDVEFNYSTKRIFLNGLLNQQKGVGVYVRSTVAPDSIGSFDYIDNPVVSLYKNGELMEILVECDTLPGYYTSSKSSAFDYNDGYSVGVEAEGFESVISEEIFLVRPLSLYKTYVSLIDSIERELYITSYIENRLGNDYFSIKIHRYVDGFNQLFKPNEVGIFSAYSDEMYKDTISFTRKIDILRDSVGLVSYDSILVELYTISESYYKYITSLSYYDESHLDPFNEYISPVYSNIDHGVGFFASYSKYLYSVNY